jgi:REP element-mobilizing transposase RayT
MDKYHPPFRANTFYHVFNHANGNEDIFREEDNYRFFLEKYEKYISPVADTFAYCLMKNHFHLLVRVGGIEQDLQDFQNLGGLGNKVSQSFSNLFNSYTKAFNKKYKRMGSLFIPNVRRIAIDEEEYLRRSVVYIHRNPIHHGFVDDIRHWPHTSYFKIWNQTKSFIKVEEVLTWFGCIEEFEKTHELNRDDRSAFE